MPNLIRISDAASLGLHMMVYLSEHPGTVVSTREIATYLSVSENHLAKVGQRLHKAGLVDATRGPKGGFKLAKPAEDIRLLEVYEAIEGNILLSDCLLGHKDCGRDHCVLGGLVKSVNAQVLNYFGNTTLAGGRDDICKNN